MNFRNRPLSDRLAGWALSPCSCCCPRLPRSFTVNPELPAYIATALICMVGAGILCEYKPKTPSSTHAKALWQSRCAGWCWP